MSEKFSPIEMLDKLISFDTVSRNSNLPIIEFIKDYLYSFGVESHLVYNSDKTKSNLYANVGPSEVGGVILSGHTDVVPIDGQNWNSDPFKIKEINEEILGELFCYFMLETIILGKLSKINPFDQPAVEQVKKITKSLLS